ncbi:MAG: DNA replication and repair protein RecF [Candidatus Cloacimonetes bacterium]|nr:DNA replication and repair protein RecF [Candidatus Cloacimonadota bacterium]
MILQRIALGNYRNYQARDFDLDAAGNLIIGPNGCGKTNLLEAIAYCGIGRSIRGHKDEDLLMHGTSYWQINAGFITDNERSLQVGMAWGDGRKLLRLNGVPAKQLSSLFDQVKTIYCAPQEPLLINGSPRLRRQYFDLAISQLYPGYIPLLRELNHVVSQRNALLKGSWDAKQKESWDLSLIKANQDVLTFRMKYLELINKALAEGPGFVAPLAQKPQLRYLPVIKDSTTLDAESLLYLVQKMEAREKHWQRSLFGAHLDDWDFYLDGRAMKSFASQGQKQMVAIALKLLQARLIKEVTGIKPVLLLDDVFAELDSYHSQKIRDLVNDGLQVLVASPRADIASEWPMLKPLKGFGAKA